MKHYYNENNPDAARWLKNLITEGQIADGDIDERSIIDVQPHELLGYTQCHFFAGIGGWSRAADLAQWPDSRELWTGSCPCQPFSTAGKGAGQNDPRHLWPHFFRLIRAQRPAVVVGEQVAGKAGYGWFDGVRSDLAGEDYACRGVDIPACAVDAPHIRSRLYWIAMADAESRRQGAIQQPRCIRVVQSGDAPSGSLLADADSGGRNWRPQDTVRCTEQRVALERPDARSDPSFWSDAEPFTYCDGKTRRAKSSIPMLAHGVSNRVAKWRGLGNAIVPPLAAEVLKAYLEEYPL